MIEKREITKTYCDSCDKVLIRRKVYTNNGAYQNDYVTVGKIDLCFTCAGKIFDREFKRDIKEEDLKDMVLSLKKSESSNPLGPDLSGVSEISFLLNT